MKLLSTNIKLSSNDLTPYTFHEVEVMPVFWLHYFLSKTNLLEHLSLGNLSGAFFQKMDHLAYLLLENNLLFDLLGLIEKILFQNVSYIPTIGNSENLTFLQVLISAEEIKAFTLVLNF